MAYITIGKIIQPRGLQGEVKVYPLTHFSHLRYKKNNQVFIEKDGQYSPLTVASYRRFNELDLVQFLSFNTQEAVLPLSGLYLYAIKEDIRLSKDTYFYGDLIGCNVVTDTDQPVGVVKKIEDQTAQVLLRVGRVGSSDVLIPFIKVFIKKVDLEHQRITVTLLDGML